MPDADADRIIRSLHQSQWVVSGKLRDQVISFQLKNQFEPLGVLENYLPEDKQSDGHAAHLVWRNPYVDSDSPPKHRLPRDVESVRIATCQLQSRAVSGFDEFMKQVEYFVDVAADYEADFIVFPEMFTVMLLNRAKSQVLRLSAIVILIANVMVMIRLGLVAAVVAGAVGLVVADEAGEESSAS